jgi:sulfur carrier protein
MITIKVNQKILQFSETLTIAVFVRFITINMNGTTIAINSNVIKKSDWSFRVL